MPYEKKKRKKNRPPNPSMDSPGDHQSSRDLEDVRKYMAIKKNPGRMKNVQSLAKAKLEHSKNAKQENID